MFRIWCQVSGGVTGTRAAWLKRNGELQTFASLQEAEALAKELTTNQNASPYRTANYYYSAREI